MPDDFRDWHFPAAGIDVASPFWQQPNRDIGGGKYARSSPAGVNVRGYEQVQDRVRGGTRAGLVKYINSPVVAGWIIQHLNLLVGVGYGGPGGHAVQFSNSGRVVTVVAVSQGNIYVANAGDGGWTVPTNGTGNTPPLNFSGVVYSAPNNQKLWFADGVNYVYYDPSINTVLPWAATAGILPKDSQNNTPRLICTWRGRAVLSGVLNDPQNWFMSAVSDPTNFDYAPLSPSPAQAVAGNNAPQGLIGDVVTSMCPYTDDVLIMFGDHSIYMFHGDPGAGGQIDLVSDRIGGVWGICWEKDPYGNVYFVSNKTGIYKFVPGQQPQRISQAIETLLQNIDTGANNFRLIWDDRWQGLHIFITPIVAPAATFHLFYEQRSGAWWQDQFGSSNFDPMTCCVFDGNTPGDRVALLGSWDGYVRKLDPASITDDGVAIASSVVIGPLLTKDLDDVLVKDMQAILGVGSANVTFAVYVGVTAEIALASSAILTGTWSAGRNYSNLVRYAGHALYLKLTSTGQWAMEQIRLRVELEGRVRQRGR